MAIKINTALEHIEKSLKRNAKFKFSLPGFVLDSIQTAIDAKGWTQGITPEFITVTTAGPTLETELPNVPDDELHYFIACHVSHTDALGAHELRIAHRLGPNAIASGVTIRESTESDVGEFRAIERPFLIAPGGRLVGVSDTSIPLGADFGIAGQFLRLALGEYVTGSPYG